jgi:hypothetical protein
MKVNLDTEQNDLKTSSPSLHILRLRLCCQHEPALLSTIAEEENEVSIAPFTIGCVIEIVETTISNQAR